MDREKDPKGGTDELFVSIPVLFSDDAFGNEHATEEHTGQKIAKAVELEEELEELLVGV